MKGVRFFWILVLVVAIGIAGVISYVFYEIRKDNEFGTYKVPAHLAHLQKPRKNLSTVQIDSLKHSMVGNEKIVVTGSGYNGYQFYYSHKKDEEGEIFIRGFESEREIELMKELLPERTRKAIKNANGEWNFYHSETPIHEGTFEKFYPVRFELWFKSKNGGKKYKLTDVEYLIDGWDF